MFYDLQFFLEVILPKLIISTVCGLIIGYDRERKNKAAGIKTNILICVGCTIFTMIPKFIMIQYPNLNIDPTRVIGQIITGIGFLGAGVIMKNNDKIVGVTTSAFIWIVSAIGVFIGAMDLPVTSILMALGTVIISRAFNHLEKELKLKNKEKENDVSQP
jgi:putative Mg2+ transporter-C (MgtC) family protein